MSLCYVGRHSYFCNANKPILFPICQYNDINIIAEHCICQLPLSETLVRDERKIGSRDIVCVCVCETVNMSFNQTTRTNSSLSSSGSEPGCRPARKVSHEFYINLNPESRPGWPRWWPPIIASYTLHSDLEDTKRAAISASELPLSLINVGVGRRLQEYERSG